jgi:hypothetical protein
MPKVPTGKAAKYGVAALETESVGEVGQVPLPWLPDSVPQ